MRLRHKLAILFALFGAAITGGFQYNHIRVLRRETYARLENMGEVTLNAVRALAEAQAREGNYAGLGRNFESLVRQTNVAAIVVADARRRRLVGRSDDSQAFRREPHPGVPIDGVMDGYYDVEAPVDLGARGRGRLTLSFHTDKLNERLREIESRGVSAGVMAFLAITMAAWLLGTWLGLNVERLVPSLESLPKDPEKFRPIRFTSSGDEVSRLIAAFNRLGASLKVETQRRRELEQEKKELSAMLVHDLKTPLTVIELGVTLLQDQVKNSDLRAFDLLNMSTGRLRRMVEDILQLSRLEEVGLRGRERVNMAAVARQAAKDFELVTAGREQRLAVEIDRTAAATVSGDEALLRRVLDNLLHNAVEHTPKGGQVTLKLEAMDDGARGESSVRLSVSDSGPGIPTEARADLFRKFFQKDYKRHVGNVGLGLALCEKVVHRHGGTIGVEDAKPKGGCFYFILPVVEDA